MGKRPYKNSRSHGDPWLELIRIKIQVPGRQETPCLPGIEKIEP